MKKIDFLAVGDIVIDAFIKLEDARVNCDKEKEGCELCVRFGDKVPYESVNVIYAVGNSPNAAVSASRLGLNTALITNIGDDQNGKDCLNVLEKEKIITEYVTAEESKKTNYHYVLLYDVDRTILIKHTPFTYKFPEIKEEVSWVYLSSLAKITLPYHGEISEFLKKHPETKLAFQPGTFQMEFSIEELKDIYSRTEVFFCNVEEAERILDKKYETTTDKIKKILELSKELQSLGPKMIVISDGPNGAYLYLNEELYHVPVYPDIAPPFDRTGAGDAFSSTFTAMLALGKDPIEAFTYAPVNSMSVVQKLGAQEGLLSLEKIEEYLKNAPANYKVEKVN